MKYRDYKDFKTGSYYHIFNRGVNKEDIFKNEQDYIAFKKRIKIILGKDSSSYIKIEPCPLGSFEINAYCLMKNHFHLLIKQSSNVKISSLILKLCTSYSLYFNKKYERVGSLFQDTFKARLITSSEDLMQTSAYIHNNPKIKEQSKHSSINEYAYKIEDICFLTDILDLFNGSEKNYITFVNERKSINKKLLLDS